MCKDLIQKFRARELIKEKRAEMIQRSNGGRTVPQVFINNIHVGGCDELYDLESMGNLDKLLIA